MERQKSPEHASRRAVHAPISEQQILETVQKAMQSSKSMEREQVGQPLSLPALPNARAEIDDLVVETPKRRRNQHPSGNSSTHAGTEPDMDGFGLKEAAKPKTESAPFKTGPKEERLPNQDAKHTTQESIVPSSRERRAFGSTLQPGSLSWRAAVKFSGETNDKDEVEHLRPSISMVKKGGATSLVTGQNFKARVKDDCDILVQKICERHFSIVDSLLANVLEVEQQVMALEGENAELCRRLSQDDDDIGTQTMPTMPVLHESGSEKNNNNRFKADPSQSCASRRYTNGSPPSTSGQTSDIAPVPGRRLSIWRETESYSHLQHVESGTASCDWGDEHQFDLWPAWEARNITEIKGQRSNGKSAYPAGAGKKSYAVSVHQVIDQDLAFNMEDGGLDFRQTNACIMCCRRRMVSPNNIIRISFWDPLSLFLVLIECVYIPLQFFPLGESTFQIMLAWVSRIFWTLEIPFSFMTGFQKTDGTVVLEPADVAKRYLRSWLCLDVALTTIDWLEVVFTYESGTENALRIGKTMKTMRMLRTLRLARVLRRIKLPEAVSALVYITKSDIFAMAASIFRIVLMLVFINHFLACVWYGIGARDRDPTWLQASEIGSTSLWYQYLTSYHWALSQFIGSMEVYPVNADERFFNVIAGTLAFFAGAIIISTITSQMTHWDMLTAGESARVSTLVDFLQDNDIERVLTMKIVRSAQLALADQKKHLLEQNVELLNLVPQHLKLELDHSLYMPDLEAHPFLSRYNALCQRTMQGVCHHTLNRLSVVAGSIVFGEGEVPPSPKVYKILEGELVFVMGRSVGKALTSQKFVCEASLWTPWFHRGTLLARRDASLLAIDVEKFQDVVNAASRSDYTVCLEYGRAFLEALNAADMDDQTDLYDSEQFHAEEWLDECYPVPKNEHHHGYWPFKRSVVKNFTKSFTVARLHN